jgi:phenylacetate-CoA ligase
MTASPPTLAVETAYRVLSRVSSYTAWKHFERLQANQWLSRAELDRLRWARFQALLAHAGQIPFYRDLWRHAGVEPHRFTRLEDVCHLPVVTRQDVIRGQENDAFLLSRRQDCESTHSSGTTGPSIYIPFTRDDLQVKYAAYLRAYYATDWRLGVRSAAMHPASHPQFKGRYTGRPDRDNFAAIRTLAFRLAHRRLLLTPYFKPESGDDTFPREWYAALRRHQPFLLETMDFNLVALYQYIREQGLPPLRIPRTIVLATLAPGFKRRLEAAFDTEIFDRYGPHEVEGTAFACHEHRGMHMAIDSVHTEFLDDEHRRVGPGEDAHIVLTDLDSRAMPLIRYRIGDTGSYLDEPCTCGRGFPLMQEIAARTRDLFETSDGRRVAAASLVALLQDEPAIAVFQITQLADRTLEARVVPDRALWTSGSEQQIRAKLADAWRGSEAGIRVLAVERVQLEPNGKFCYAKRSLA